MMKKMKDYECENCHTVTRRMAVHHIIPLETARSPNEMMKLCFDVHNLQVLCYDCHKEIHLAMGRRGKRGHKQAEADRIKRYESAGTDRIEYIETL